VRELTLIEQRDWYRRVAEHILTAVEERDLPPVVFCPIVEPFSQGQGDNYERWARWLKKVPGARVYAATTVAPMQKPHLDAVTDVRCYHGWTVDKYCLNHRIGFNQISHELRRSDDEGWIYYDRRRNDPRGSAEFTRLLNGFWLWQTPLSVSMPTTYLPKESYSRGRCPGTSPAGMTFVYPNENGDGPVPTIQWEAFREGWDDLRYLYTLQALAWKAEKVPALRKQAKQAEALLLRLRNRFPVGEETLTQMMERLAGREYDASRGALAQMIVRLQEAASGTEQAEDRRG